MTGEALWSHASGWFVSGSAGLRYQAVREIEFDRQRTGMRADFSGVVLRVATGYDWPPRQGAR